MSTAPQPSEALLAIDLGTSGVKVVVIDAATQHTLAETEADYLVHRPHPGWAETNPEDWWQATIRAVRDALAKAGAVHIAAIGLDGQMHGLVLCDGGGIPVRAALLWADQRAGDQLYRWLTLPADLRLALGNPITPGMLGPLWSWVRQHEAEVEQRARWALLPKDWVRYRLTNNFATDASDASATLLWNLFADDWDSEVAGAVDLDARKLPPVHASFENGGGLSLDAAMAFGLPPGLAVATGAADTAASLFATGLTDPSSVQITVGTGAQVVRPLREPMVEANPVIHTYRGALPNSWYAMAAVQNGGLALDWARGIFNASWEELYGAAHTHAPGAGGVTFVPYITGERSPVLADSAQGAFFGLQLASDRNAVLQAAVEGVAFAIRHAFEALPGARPKTVRIAGGGTQGSSFRTLLAGVLNVSLEPVTMRSASAVGAALLAGLAIGMELDAAAVVPDAIVAPPENAEAYSEPFARYVELTRFIAHPQGKFL